MIEKIRPDRVVKAVEMIDLEQLKLSGIRALIIDIDNTLTPHQIGRESCMEKVYI